MTKRDVANLLLKAFAIYSFLLALQNAPYLINDLLSVQEPVFPKVLQIIMPTFTMFLAGILLWVMSGRAAILILGGEVTEESINASIQDIQVLAFSLGGLYLIAYALPDLIKNSLIYAWLNYQGSKTEGVVPILISSIIQLGIGAWLLFGARGIVVLIKKIRKAGQFRS